MNYKRIHDNIIERAKNRIIDGYKELHHIVPRCMGGTDDDSNLVKLTPEEHFVVHQLLVKMYPENGSLIYAATKMCVGHKGKRTNKRYGWLKRRFSKQRKKDSIGKGNSQHGTIWINRVGTTENKKIKKSEPIPNGWVKGRKLKIKICKVCNLCECICGDLYKNKLVSEAKSLLKEFLESDYDTIRKFAKHKHIHQPALTNRWKRHIDGYEDLCRFNKGGNLDKSLYFKLL